MGKKWKQWQILFSWAPKLLWMVTAAMKLKDTCSLEEKLWQTLDSILKSRWHHFAKKGPYSQSYGVSNGHVWMWELDRNEGWVSKHWCFWIVMLEKSLESPWTARRSNQSVLKEINPKYSLEGLMLKLKLRYFGHPMQRASSLEKALMLGKIEGQRRKGVAEDEMII